MATRDTRRAACICMAALFMSGCASSRLVERDAPAAQAAASSPQATAVAAALPIDGPHGRLNAAQRARLIAHIDAQGPGTDLQRHLAAQQDRVAPERYAAGSAQLLVDGPATFAAMFRAIEAARHTVLLESYIIEDADVALRLAELLKRKRAQGVQMAVIYDSVGSFGTDSAYFRALREAGIPTCAFNPLVPKRRIAYWNLAHRDHRKILVIDGQVAFTGGINISAVYRSGSFSRSGGAVNADNGWRDTQVQLRGPAAKALDELVRETWRHQGCQPLLPPPAEAGSPAASGTPRGAPPQLITVLPSSPLDDFNRIYAMLLTAIDVSRRSAWFTMAYFAPTADMLDAMADAARRGVDVRLILPSFSDFSPVLHAGRSHYTQLLEAGVKLYELQGSVLHAKTVVIDGVLSSVGSSNLDWRSLAGNNEVNAVIFGEAFGRSMQAMFLRDLQACHPVTLAQWEQRPLWQRAKEEAAGLFERFW